ncbi:VOC family protein [Pleurocapsales cyanobacterium LEGE 06147]|nr:VOC family protein [Pleurocapsales cyanobacterium LEGE 06147]
MSKQSKLKMQFQFVYTRLNVRNFEACLYFYHELLGFDLTFVSKKDGCAELNTGTTKLALLKRNNLEDVIGRANSVSYDKSNDGIALSFQVHDLDEVCKQLKTQAIKFVTNEPLSFPEWGFRSTFCRDPEGNLLEIQQIIS